MNKTIYIIHFESYSEFEAVFDDNFQYVSAWDGNDANWRNEYFSDFMKKLGIVVKTELPKKVKSLDLEKVAFKKMYGYDLPESE